MSPDSIIEYISGDGKCSMFTGPHVERCGLYSIYGTVPYTIVYYIKFLCYVRKLYLYCTAVPVSIVLYSMHKYSTIFFIDIQLFLSKLICLNLKKEE
jgi:hypothetical protein